MVTRWTYTLSAKAAGRLAVLLAGSEEATYFEVDDDGMLSIQSDDDSIKVVIPPDWTADPEAKEGILTGWWRSVSSEAVSDS